MRFLLVVLGAFILPATAFSAPLHDDDYGEVSDFRLTERSGRTVTRDDLLGKVWIASFVITHCPDGKCPQVTQTLKRLQDDLAGRRNLLLVTFTVDPDRDDPAALKRYADAHGADADRWLFLTGHEDTIDSLVRSFSVRAGPRVKGQLDHSQKLFLIDRRGHIRALCDGLYDSRFMSEEDFQADLRKFERKADKLLEPELPAYLPSDFPAFNAALNGLSGVLILLGYVAIRRRLVRLHASCMLSAIAVSAGFLASYLFYHLVVKEGRPTRFTDQAPAAPKWVAYLYLGILLTHTLLAVFAAPMAIYTAYRGLRGQIASHVRVARWTLPIWLYVSMTGVVVYWMLYRLYPPG
jgi:protein SCO1/2/putative membrane protein